MDPGVAEKPGMFIAEAIMLFFCGLESKYVPPPMNKSVPPPKPAWSRPTNTKDQVRGLKGVFANNIGFPLLYFGAHHIETLSQRTSCSKVRFNTF